MARTYTPEEKERALKLFADQGAAAAARETDIPRTTISRWASTSGVMSDRAEKTRVATEAAAVHAAAKREALKSASRERALDLIERMAHAHIEFVGKDGRREEIDKATAGACKDYAIAAGVLIDKAELLDGRATSRNEIRNIDQLDGEIERLLDGVGA